MKGKARILVIEDELPLALLMAHVLTQAGCAVQVATTGKKGLALASARQFDLITLDLELPDTSGLEICRELSQGHRSHTTPVIIISGKPAESAMREAMTRGAVAYLPKPFVVSDFVDRVISHATAKIDEAAIFTRAPALNII